jgi:ribose-phosphate pyrophosphokinase
MTELKIFSGTANPGLAESVARSLGLPPGKLKSHHFPDGEISIEIEEDVRGKEIYLVQSTSPPVADNLLELLLIIDAACRSGAEKITAVVPYFGYARQDRRVTGIEPIGAHVIARLLGSAASLTRIIVVDLHNPSVEGFFNLPLENVSAASLLAEAARKDEAEVVVSPDLGAAKLAEHFAALLGLPVAIVHKGRISSTEVKVHAVVGDVQNKRPLIVDDIISTGGTIEAAARAILAAGCLPEISVAATHGLLAGPAIERLRNLPLKHLFLTNSISRQPENDLSVEEVDLGPLLAGVIRRLHNQESIVDLLVHL